jgi:hypothetical protein
MHDHLESLAKRAFEEGSLELDYSSPEEGALIVCELLEAEIHANLHDRTGTSYLSRVQLDREALFSFPQVIRLIPKKPRAHFRAKPATKTLPSKEER